jgi:hypothetical protein
MGTEPKAHGDASRRISEAVYGTIVLLAAIDYLVQEHEGPLESAVSIAGGACVLFFARLYSEAIAERAATNQRGGGEGLVRIASVTWPVAAVAGPPLVLLMAAALHAMSHETALDVASGYCVVALGVASYVAARLTHASTMRRILSTALALVVGLALAGLKELF